MFGVEMDLLDLIQRMGNLHSLGSKSGIRLSPMKCAMLFTINFRQAGRLRKRGPAQQEGVFPGSVSTLKENGFHC
jgi:hypothetical protein